MTNKNKLLVTFDDWMHHMAEDNVILLSTYLGVKDPMKLRKLLSKYLKFYIEILVFDALNSKPSGENPTKKEMYDFAYKNFNDIKYNIQNDVAEGFSKAMNQWTGKNADYYCQILITPPPISRESQ